MPANPSAPTLTWDPSDSLASTNAQALGPFTTPRAKYNVRVAWGQQIGQPNIFTFGVSTFGGTSVLASDPWSTSFTGPNDDITNPGDLTAVTDFTTTRGRSDLLTDVQGATAEINILDPIGKFNRKNASSVLAGVLDPMRPVEITYDYLSGTFGRLTGRLFFGFIDRIDWQPTRRSGQATIVCIDFFSWLDNTSPVIATMTNTTTGACIGAVLDALNWTDTSMRNLAVGDNIASFSADGGRTGLQIIADLLRSERGVFFINKQGQATYISRNQLAAQTSSATFTDVVANLATGADRSRVVNRWTVTPNGGAPQIASDQTSINRYGLVDDSLAPLYLSDPNKALSLAQYMLTLTKSADTPVWDTQLRNADDYRLSKMLLMEAFDRLTINSIGGTSGDYRVQQLRHQVTRGGVSHIADLKLAEMPATKPFIFGVSTFGGADPLGY